MVNRSFHFNRGLFKEGDTVYYRSPESRYAIRKAKVAQVEVRQHEIRIPIIRHRRGLHQDKNLFIPYDVLTLENGIVLKASEVFATKQQAEAHLIEELKERLTFQQVQLENLKQEMAYEEKALRRLEQGQS